MLRCVKSTTSLTWYLASILLSTTYGCLQFTLLLVIRQYIYILVIANYRCCNLFLFNIKSIWPVLLIYNIAYLLIVTYLSATRCYVQARVESSHEVLEIGSGWGALAIQLVRRIGCRYTGITLSQEQLEYAQALVKEARLEVQQNFAAIPQFCINPFNRSSSLWNISFPLQI